MGRLSCSVPAKINLHLEVLGKRADGYHELRTLLQSIDLRDELWAESTDGPELSLIVEPEGSAPEGPSNLVLGAAEALRTVAGGRLGARMGLVKRIPAGAGLGGGSGDAAGALVLLSVLWGLNLSEERLAEVAAGLGSDVPFFLRGGLGLGVGRGERILPLPDLEEPLHLAIAWPEVAISTSEVYNRLEAPLTWKSPEGTVEMGASDGIVPAEWTSMRNDLEPVVVDGWPQVAAIRDAMLATEALAVRVTGSGSAVFGVFCSRLEAEMAARHARAAGAKGWHVGRTLPREQARIRAQ